MIDMPAPPARPAAPPILPLERGGTIGDFSLEGQAATFTVLVKRGPVFNVIYRAPRWEYWRIRAVTLDAALRVADYHFPNRERGTLCVLEWSHPSES